MQETEAPTEVTSPPPETTFGQRIEDKVRASLIAAGISLLETGDADARKKLDEQRKTDMVITRLPGLPYPDVTIAVQVTTDSRIGRKPPKFYYESRTVARFRVYLRIREPNGTAFGSTFGEVLRSILCSWLMNVNAKGHDSIVITLNRDFTYAMRDLKDMIDEHAARVFATVGEPLAGCVRSYIADREFGFVDCSDPRLVDRDEEQGDFQFFFTLSDCTPEIAERLKSGEKDVKVSFRNDGYDNNRSRDSAPRARKLEVYVPPAPAQLIEVLPYNPEALRALMQGIYDGISLKTVVTPPPLSPELWRALREYGYYPLWLPTIGKDEPFPKGFTVLEDWQRGPIQERWVAIETIKANPHRTVAHTEAEIAAMEREEGYAPRAAFESKERYADDRLAKAIELPQRLGIRPDDLYGVYLRRIANLLGSHPQKVRLPTAEEWLFIAGLLNLIRERDREDLPNLLEPCDVFELVANTDPAIPGYKSAIGGSSRTPVSFTRLPSYVSNSNVAFRTLIELE